MWFKFDLLHTRTHIGPPRLKWSHSFSLLNSSVIYFVFVSDHLISVIQLICNLETLRYALLFHYVYKHSLNDWLTACLLAWLTDKLAGWLLWNHFLRHFKIECEWCVWENFSKEWQNMISYWVINIWRSYTYIRLSKSKKLLQKEISDYNYNVRVAFSENCDDSINFWIILIII